MRYLIAVLVIACSSPPAKTPASPAQAQGSATTAQSPLDKLMRDRMNKVFSQLIFQVFHADGDPDFGALTQQASELRGTVDTVRHLPTPAVISSDEAREVFYTYNDTLQRDSDKFSTAVDKHDIDGMRSLLTKIGQTCNQCHHFFRLKIDDAPEK
jgi:cytochrome c556